VRVLGLCVCVTFCLVACVACVEPREQPHEAYVGLTHTTSAEVEKAYWDPGLTPNLRIGPRVMRACRPDFGEIGESSRYWYDPAGLMPEDRGVLLQLAQCMRSGALKGRAVLVLSVPEEPGQTDRNNAIVAERAVRTMRYLVDHGVAPDDVTVGAETEVDAGVGVIRDGRVKVELLAR
jgi:hypothetical protein